MNWIIPLLKEIAKGAPVCAAGLLVLGALGYWWGSTTFALAQDLEAERIANTEGFQMILDRIELSDINEEIREVEEELAQMELLSMDTDPASGSADIIRDSIRNLNLDLEELRLKRDQQLGRAEQ
jgi:hypothetical protein